MHKFRSKVFFWHIVWAYFKAQSKKQSFETMTHTVNLAYYQRLEMAECPKRIAEFGILTKRFNFFTSCRLSPHRNLNRVRKCFLRPKREAEFGNGNLPAEPFKVTVLPVLQQLVVKHGPGASKQDSQHLPCQTKSKSKPNWDSNTMPGLQYTTE
jgi:hypothetical protein